MNPPLLTHPYREVPVAPALLEVAPGVHWLRMALPWSLDHINLWLIEEGEGDALIDTGLGDAATREIWEAVFAARGRPLTRVILTHFHPDHMGNAAWLAQRFGVPVYMSQGEFLLANAVHAGLPGYDTASMVAHFALHGLGEEDATGLLSRGNVFARGVPELPTQYHRLLPGDTLQIGPWRWQLIAGFGHSPEHIALACPEAGLLISGDMLLPRISTNVSVPATQPEEDSVGRFLTSIESFLRLPADTLVLPSHGLPFRGIGVRVAQLFAHHAERNDELLHALSEPRTAAELLPVLFSRPLDRHQLMFALSEAIAHANHLVATARARRLHAADGTIRFQGLSR